MKKKFSNLVKILFLIFFILFLILISFDIYISLSSKNQIYSEIDKLKKSEFCLLLGTSKYTTKNSENLFYKYRIDAVKRIYDSSIIDKIIVSGDNRTSSYDETKFMKKDLLKLNIPDDVIIIDSDGFRTIFSVINLFNKYKIKDAIVVSQRFHLQRAIFIGKIFGLNLTGFAANPVKGISNLKIQIRERGARIRLIFDLLDFFVLKKIF